MSIAANRITEEFNRQREAEQREQERTLHRRDAPDTIVHKTTITERSGTI